MQCDIDIIGDGSPDCEAELIIVTANALQRLDIGNFTVKINDRKILNYVLKSCGFTDGQLASVCITFDKLDKIGTEGVVAELEEKAFDRVAVEKFKDILNRLPMSVEAVVEIVGAECTEKLCGIIRAVTSLSNGKYTIEFDLSLVRGQGYYTGTVFEICSSKFKGAVAGGGRYDNLIGKFIGENIPSCGFSIGFERIFEILSDMERSGRAKKKIAFIYDDNFAEAYSRAEAIRNEYDVSIFRRPKKMKAFLDRISASGFDGFITEDNLSVKLFG